MTKDAILTLDFGDLVTYEERLCDATYIDEIIAKAAQRDVRTILWRTLGGPRGEYRSRSVPSFEDQSPKWPGLLKAVDPLAAAVESARRHGVQLLAWATLQDFHIVRKTRRNTSPFFDERPHLYWSSADGQRIHPGYPCYAYPEARDYYLDHIREVLGYGLDGVYVCFRSHAGEPEEDDSFGFNEPWRRELRDEVGFDADPDVVRGNAWLARRMQKVRGRSYSVLLRELRELAGDRPVWVGVAEEPDVLVAGHAEKENPARALHRARLDVRGWCRDDLVDAVIVVASRTNPCDPSVAELYRDATVRFGKKLYPWLNLVSVFPDAEAKWAKRTPTADELRAIVRSAETSDVDGVVLHETADLEFSYLRVYVDGQKNAINDPHPDREAQWDALQG